jgi:hypothetical protein
VSEVQETLSRAACVDPAGFGLAFAVQAVPFQCSTSVSRALLVLPGFEPTATHEVVAVQETPVRYALAPLGWDTTCQLVPFHRSISPGLPTATQRELPTQDTPCKKYELEVTTDWVAQVVPFQRNAATPPASKLPTAVQAVLEVQETELKRALESGDTPVQVAPFHTSATARTGTKSVSASNPTAMQKVLPLHDTESSSPL